MRPAEQVPLVAAWLVCCLVALLGSNKKLAEGKKVATFFSGEQSLASRAPSKKLPANDNDENLDENLNENNDDQVDNAMYCKDWCGIKHAPASVVMSPTGHKSRESTFKWPTVN